MSDVLFTVEKSNFSYQKDSNDEIVLSRAGVVIIHNPNTGNISMNVIGNRTYSFNSSDNISVKPDGGSATVISGTHAQKLALLKTQVFFVNGVVSEAGGTGGPLDATPTSGSANGVQSGGVYNALTDRYLAVNVATYADALALATGSLRKVFTVATDENSGDTNTKYFYDGVPGSLSPYGDILSDSYFSRLNNKVIVKPKAIGIAEISDALAARTAKDPYIRAIQAMGSPFKGASAGLSWAMATSHTGLTDAELIGNAMWVGEDTTMNGLAFRVVTAGSFTADAVNGVALYSFANGVLTRVVQSANAGTIFTATGWIQVPFTAPLAVTEGVYFATLLYNQSAQTTAPVLGQVTTGSVDTIYKPVLANGSRLFFKVTGQAAFPATITLSGTSNTNITPFFYYY